MSRTFHQCSAWTNVRKACTCCVLIGSKIFSPTLVREFMAQCQTAMFKGAVKVHLCSVPSCLFGLAFTFLHTFRYRRRGHLARHFSRPPGTLVEPTASPPCASVASNALIVLAAAAAAAGRVARSRASLAARSTPLPLRRGEWPRWRGAGVTVKATLPPQPVATA